MNQELRRFAIKKLKSATWFWAVIILISAITVKFLPDVITVSRTMELQKAHPIRSVKTQDKKIALTFDVLSVSDNTDKILDILGKKGITGTFFLTGGFVGTYPEDVIKILDAGHEIGNHGENHKNMSQITKEEKRNELLGLHKKVKDLTGYEMNLFRPPFGDYDNELMEITVQNNYYPILWDVDSLDWKDYGSADIVRTVTRHEKLSNGSVILLHNGSKYLPEALSELIQKLNEQGYEIVPVGELIHKGNYQVDAKGRQYVD